MFNYKSTSIAFLTILVGLLVIRASIWMIFLIILLYLLILAWGSFSIRLNFYLSSIHSHTFKNNMIALTFDDGPTPETLQVLEVLDKWDAKATFFCIGENVTKHPEVLMKIHQKGHLIGNHTYHHRPTFPMATVQAMMDEVRKTSVEVANIVGVRPVYFRPPFGVTNPRIAKTIKALNMKSIGWNQRSFDTISNNPEKIVKRVTSTLSSGDIILFHDNLVPTASIVDKFLAIATEKGFKSERLDKLLNIPAYDQTSI